MEKGSWFLCFDCVLYDAPRPAKTWIGSIALVAKTKVKAIKEAKEKWAEEKRESRRHGRFSPRVVFHISLEP